MMNKKNAVVLAAALLVANIPLVFSACPVIDDDEMCPAGCWHNANAQDNDDDDGHLTCLSVGAGFYSPVNNNNRAPCGVGTASSEMEAETCMVCPPGTFGGTPALSDCELCPPGTYSDTPGSVSCKGCFPDLYAGEGAEDAALIDGSIRCLKPDWVSDPTLEPTREPTNRPTQSPTMAPTTPAPSLSPTDVDETFAPTTTPSPTRAPHPFPTPEHTPYSSLVPTAQPTFQPGASPQQDSPSPTPTFYYNGEEELVNSDVCGFNEYKIHGQCSQCAPTGEAWAMLGWIAALILGLVFLFPALPEAGREAFWSGLVYLQYIYMLGLVPLRNNPAIMSFLHAVLAPFFFDLDSAFSLQCFLGTTVHADEFLVLVLPVAAALLLSALSQCLTTVSERMEEYIKTNAPFLKYFAIVVYLSSPKLFMTSWAALQTEDASSPKPMAMGIVGLVLYSVLFVAWLAKILYDARTREEEEGEEEDEDQNGSAKKGYPYLWARDFPRHQACWWWALFILLRSWVLGICIHEALSVGVTFIVFLCVYGGTWLYTNQKDNVSEDEEGSNGSWLTNKRLALVFLLSVTMLDGLTYWLSKIEEDGSTLPVCIVFVIIFSLTVIYWVATLFARYIEQERAEKEGDTAPRGDTFDADEEEVSFEPEDVSVPAMRSVDDRYRAQDVEMDAGARHNLSLMPADPNRRYDFDEDTIATNYPANEVQMAPSWDVSALTEPGYSHQRHGRYDGYDDQYETEHNTNDHRYRPDLATFEEEQYQGNGSVDQDDMTYGDDMTYACVDENTGQIVDKYAGFDDESVQQGGYRNRRQQTWSRGAAYHSEQYSEE